MEEVTKCSYVNCVDDAEKERIFHELPACDTALCVKWLINSGHEDFIGRDFTTLRSLKFFVCNNHFTEDCYLSKGTLKDNAIPLPHWKAITEGTRNHRKRTEHGYESRIGGVPYPPPQTRRDAGSTIGGLSYKKEYRANNKASIVSTSMDRQKTDGWCRTCATKRVDLNSMITKKSTADMSLLSKLKLLIEIDDGDGLPLRMCNDCVAKLEQSFKFFQQIYVADNALRQIFPKAGTKLEKASSGSMIRSMHADKASTVPIGRCPRRRWCKMKKAKTITPLADEKTVGEERIVPDDSSPISPRKDLILGNRENTVFSLLTDTCRSDEELNWIDVLKLMKRQKYSRWQVKRLGRKKRKIQCEFCGATFALRRQLKTHLTEKHNRLGEKSCKDLDASFEKEQAISLKPERELGEKEGGYLCDDCGARLGNKTKLRRHVDRHRSNDGVGFTCDSCGEEFRRKGALIEHAKGGGARRAKETVVLTADEESRPRVALCSGIPPRGDVPQVPEVLELPKGATQGTTEDSKEIVPNGSRAEDTESAVGDRDRVRGQPEKPSGEQPQIPKSTECACAFTSREEPLTHQKHHHSTQEPDSTCLLCGNGRFSSPEEYECRIAEHSTNRQQLCE